MPPSQPTDNNACHGHVPKLYPQTNIQAVSPPRSGVSGCWISFECDANSPGVFFSLFEGNMLSNNNIIYTEEKGKVLCVDLVVETVDIVPSDTRQTSVLRIVHGLPLAMSLLHALILNSAMTNIINGKCLGYTDKKSNLSFVQMPQIRPI